MTAYSPSPNTIPHNNLKRTPHNGCQTGSQSDLKSFVKILKVQPLIDLILTMLQRSESVDPAHFINDREIETLTGIPAKEIRKQLNELRKQGRIKIFMQLDGSFQARVARQEGS